MNTNTKTARKSRIWNILMICAMALIAVTALLYVGRVRGWFDKGQSDTTKQEGTALQLKVEKKLGGANILRDGIAYALPEGTVLRSGDEVQTLHASTLCLSYGDSNLVLNENSTLHINALEEAPALSLESGELFADNIETLRFTLLEQELEIEQGSFFAEAPYGSARLGVLGGRAIYGQQEVEAGQGLSLLPPSQGGESSFALSLASLSSFQLDQLQKRESGQTLCFTQEDVDTLLTARENEKRLALEAKLMEGEAEARIRAQQENGKNNPQAAPVETQTEDVPTVTIEIRCDTILSNMDNLREGKNAYVPANGLILAPSRLSFTEGETAFDVLKRACELAGIQIEYSWTPLYNSYYIEGINHLYQFDCGQQSGWMYKVNGWFPNYGCSSYQIKNGDSIVWCYTCTGLGADVGGGMS